MGLFIGWIPHPLNSLYPAQVADYRGWTPLHVAASYDYPEMCRMLIRLGADPEARASNGQTPLFFAAKTDSVRALRALLKQGCDPKARDYRQRTPLFAACELGEPSNVIGWVSS